MDRSPNETWKMNEIREFIKKHKITVQGSKTKKDNLLRAVAIWKSPSPKNRKPRLDKSNFPKDKPPSMETPNETWKMNDIREFIKKHDIQVQGSKTVKANLLKAVALWSSEARPLKAEVPAKSKSPKASTEVPDIIPEKPKSPKAEVPKSPKSPKEVVPAKSKSPKHEEKPKEFFACGKVEPFAFDLLKRLGFVETKEQSPKKVDFLYSAPGCDKNIWNVECEIQCVVDTRTKAILVFKDSLHYFLRKTDYIARTFPLERFTYMGGVYIIRPSGRGWFAGKGISYVSTLREARLAIDNCYKMMKEKGHTKFIVSEVIRKPLLFKGFKFHLRLYLAVVCSKNFSELRSEKSPDDARSSKGKVKFMFANIGEILTASKPYVEGDWQNKDIHDTHFGSTARDNFFPEDFPNKKMVPSIIKQLDGLASYLETNVVIKPYDTAKVAYEVFGADVMVTRDGKIKLIEINDKISYQMVNDQDPRTQNFFKILEQWEYDFIKPLLE